MKVPTQKSQQGFNLIELMIVVGIIGILSAIAIPAFQDYIIKSQAISALAEISPAKTQFEIAVNESSTPQNTTAANVGYIGIGMSTAYCADVVVVASALPSGAIVCTLGGSVNSNISGGVIAWFRTSTGVWNCATSGTGFSSNAKWKPGTCS